MYAMHLTNDTAEFLGNFFPTGVLPVEVSSKIEDGSNFFIFNNDKTYGVITSNEFFMRYDSVIIPKCAVFKVG